VKNIVGERSKLAQINHGDALQILKTFESDNIDSIVTDPPYGYAFMNKDWDRVVIPTSTWKECLRVLKPGSFAFIMSSPRQDVLSRAICNLQDAGFETGFSSIYWTYASGFPKAANVSKLVDKRLGAQREIIGQRQDNYAGFQPKPAVEIILVCMKPLDQKSYVDQALSNRKGVTWLDDCRIPYQNEDDINNVNNTRKAFIDQGGVKFPVDKGWNQNQLNDANRPIEINQKGRFPANLICQDDVLNDGKIYKSGDIKPHTVFNSGQRVLNYRRNAKTITSVSKGDSGSFSRYFDLDRWFETTFPFLIIPKASKSERNM
jgi:site-specific DNA-methyltransferase (adenine-specific)